MKIKTLQIHNFLSIENADLNFNETGVVLLDGWNFDDDTANGAGKSAVFNALSFGLYGKVPRDVTTSEVLRKGTKTGYVTVTVECNDGLYGVRRERPANVTYF